MSAPDRPSPTAPAPAGSRRATALALAVFAVVYGALQYWNCVSKSATFDEPLHLTAGYLALHQHEHRLDPTHPPLLRMWAALPMLGTPRPAIDMRGVGDLAVEDWTNRSYSVARQFVFSGGQGDRSVTAGRFMIAGFGALLGVLVFLWARRWLGFYPAAFGLGLYAIEPNLTAHSGLATTDAGVVCLMFGAIYFLWRVQQSWSWRPIAGLLLCTALAVVSKFSALSLAPLLLLLLLVAVAGRTAITGRRALGLALGLVAAAVVAIWACYGFRYLPGGAGDGLLKLTAAPVVQARLPVLGPTLAWIDAHHLLPNAFTQGLAWSLATAQALGGYLNGETSAEGWWYYFPFAFLVKTPATLLLLFAAGLALLLRPAARSAWVDRAFVLVPPLVFLFIAMGSHINIGVRHILPVFPFVLLVATAAVREFLGSGRRSGRLAIAAAAVVSVASFAQSWPTTIAYFNEFVGGPANGYLYLSDSNLDWGQHLKQLRQWMLRHDVRRLNLAYFGTVDPASYGIDCIYLPGSPPVARTSPPQLPGYVAISATLLTSRFEPLYGNFRDRTPVAVIGNTIWIYWVEQWPAPEEELPDDLAASWHLSIADQLLNETHWYDRAVLHYRAYLQTQPGDGAVWERLGQALIGSGQLTAAVESFGRAVELAPTPSRANLRIAQFLVKARQPAAAEPFARAVVRAFPADRRARELLAQILAARR